MKCKCGCGQETSGKIDHGKLPEYVRGHVQRGRKYPYKPRPKAVGRLVWNKGIKGKFPNQNIQGLKLGQKRGAESLHWKGNDVGYFALHNWIENWVNLISVKYVVFLFPKDTFGPIKAVNIVEILMIGLDYAPNVTPPTIIYGLRVK